MTEREEIMAEIVEELKSTPPKSAKAQRKPRRTKAQMAEAAGTAIVPVKDDHKAELQLWEVEAQDLLETLGVALELAKESPESVSQADMDEFGRIQRAAFEKWKALEEKRKFLKEPSLEQGRRIDNEFKPGQGYCKAIEQAAKDIQALVRRLAAEAQDRALAAIAESGGQADASTLVVAHGANILHLPEASREVVKWRAEIYDTGLLPDWCWKRVIDREAIDSMVQSKGSDANIPGVRVYREVEIVNKAVRSS